MKIRKSWVIAGAVVVGLGVFGYTAYVKAKPKIAPPPSPEKAVTKAIAILGTKESSIDIADLAYTMAYPKCPKKLDPKNPNHVSCIGKWLKLREIALVELPKKQRGDSGGSKDDAPGPADELKSWLDSLTPAQKTGLRGLIGSHYDKIKAAAESGDDSDTVSAVLRFKQDIETLVEEHPIDAFNQYRDLKTLLGPKLEELLRTAQKYK